MKNMYASNISRRDFDVVNGERAYLIRNYATRIRNHLQVNMYGANLESIFHNVFGSEWYRDASFKELCTVAKLAKKNHTNSREYEVEKLVPLSRDIKVSQTRELLGANSYVNAFAKIYGKNAKEDYLARNTICEYQCDRRGVSNIEEYLTTIRDALHYAQFIKKYAPKEYAKLKRVKSYQIIRDNQWDLRDCSMSTRICDMLIALPEELREQICHDSAAYMVKIMLGDATMIDRLQAKIRARISGDAYRIAHYGAMSRDYNIRSLMTHLRDYKKAKDFARLMVELGLCASRDAYIGSLNKVNNRIYGAMKTVAKMDIDIAAKQQTVCDIAKRENLYNCSRTIWSPTLKINAEGDK